MIVELFGMARSVVGRPEVEIAIDEPARVCDVLSALAAKEPALIGAVLDGVSGGLVAPNVLLLDGQRAPLPDELIRATDKPCLLFVASGG